MFDDERIERLNICVESEILGNCWNVVYLWVMALMVGVSPDQLFTGGFWRHLVATFLCLVKLLSLGEHFSERIFTYERFPVDRIENSGGFGVIVSRSRSCEY